MKNRILQAYNERKIFSGIEDLPGGDAPETIVPGCLVLEGGAFRGLYSSGVLDAMMEEGLNLACTVGVSAGALNGMNYVSGQIGRSARVNLRYRHDSRYVGRTALRNDRGIIGFSFLFEGLKDLDPLNAERFMRPERRFVAVATNCLDGKAVYFEKGKCSSIFKAIQASASMPYVSKMVMVGGLPCLDGGCACKIPYQWAIDEGYEKIVVVKTRPDDFRKKVSDSEKRSLTDRLYKKYPEFSKTLDNTNAEYNRQCDEIEQLRKEGRLFVISPSKAVKVGRLETDMEKLGKLYYMGYEDVKGQLEELKKYLFGVYK